MFQAKLFLQSITLCALVVAAGCSSNPNRYFENDGPPGLFQKKLLPWGGGDVEIKVEKPNKWANRPYTVMGKRYYPVTGDKPMTQVGTASWYGKQFHGKKTAIGEIYDMHEMTAAHPTMELPSFAKVTNLKNGRSIIVRVNDRGPFLHGRIIDLSYAAAVKLGYQKQGTTRVRVERITRRDIAAGRIPSTSADNAVLVAASAVHEATTSTPKRTTSATPRQNTAKAATRQPTEPAARNNSVVETQTASAAPSYTQVPSTAPAPLSSSNAVPVRETPVEEQGTPVNDDVMKTVVQDSELADQVSVTLSIPVESTEVEPQDINLPPQETAPANDTMGALITSTQAQAPTGAAEPQAPAEVLPSKIPAAAAGRWSVQIGAYGVQENARQAAAHAEMMLASVQNAQVRIVDTGKVWKVLSGQFSTKDEASQFARTVSEALGTPAFAVSQ